MTKGPLAWSQSPRVGGRRQRDHKIPVNLSLNATFGGGDKSAHSFQLFFHGSVTAGWKRNAGLGT